MNIKRRNLGNAACAVVVLAVGAFFASVRHAEAMPFSCSGDIYQVQSGQLRIFDPVSSSYVNVGSPQTSYNAVGFNTLDNFAYGSQGNWIIRIEADGTTTQLFNVGASSNAGDVDNNNTLWQRRNNRRYDAIDLATGTVTTVNFSGQVQNSADVAYVNNGGTNFLISPGNNRVGFFNLDNSTSSRKNITGLPNSGGFGATWADSLGRVFTFHNDTGQIFELFNLFGAGNANAVLVAQGDPSSNNDGFSCNTAPFPTLPPLAFDDDFTTPVNTPISGNVISDNGNGADNDPEGGALTVQTTPISGPSNGSVTLNANGDFTYTPNTNFIGTDTFVYSVSDPSGLTAQATVTIIVTGTIGFTATKTQTSGPDPVLSANTTLGYDVVLENTGDIPLTNIVTTDTLPDGSVVTLSGAVETGATNPGTATSGELDVGETWTYAVTYTVTQADIDNTATITNSVSAVSDETGATPQTASVDTAVTQQPNLSMTKTASAPGFTTGNLQEVPAGTLVTYTYSVTNTGNITIDGVTINDAHPGVGSVTPQNEVLSQDNNTLLDSTDASANDGVWDILAPGDRVDFTWQYVVQQSDIETFQ